MTAAAAPGARLRRLEGLGGLAKLDFGADGTALQAKPALGAALGLRGAFFVKRDDRAGPGLGGNKTRKLQYVLADALDRGADCLITSGAVQSNHCALTTVCGGMAGLEVHLVLGGDADEMRGGNLVIDHLAAAHLHVVAADEWDLLIAESERIAGELRAQGRAPYVIPVGASMPLGAAGYADAYLELLGQLDAAGVAADWLVAASGSGGTQAGLLAGRAMAGRGPRVIGVDVAKGGGELRDTVASLAAAALDLVGGDARVPLGDVVLVDGAGPGYGQVFAANREVIRTALHTEGLLLDPVYTSKAVAAIPGMIASGLIGADDTVVFLHTGGLGALFAPAYAEALR
jgi:1-aminocyclopropane-1-carboxylate deaminase/D-cysteine desulfhydrase-like pyridoxal-dependent ACC family enzyme